MSDHQVPVATGRRYPHGVPCWVDVVAPDPQEAAEFYRGLFGWRFTDVVPAEAPGSSLTATLDGHDVAAVSPVVPGEQDDLGWRTYLACDDVDAAAAAVERAGGRVLVPPADAGPGGRAASCADPDGTVLHLWPARHRRGAQLVNAPGSWNFSHLHSPDPHRVLPFYAEVFGWVVDPEVGAGMVRVPGYGDHLAATVDPGIHERQQHAPAGFADVVAGLVAEPDPALRGWQVVFTVADRDVAASTAARLGATVLATTDTEWTREARVRDPQGATLTLSQFAPQGW